MLNTWYLQEYTHSIAYKSSTNIIDVYRCWNTWYLQENTHSIAYESCTNIIDMYIYVGIHGIYKKIHIV